jgi:tetratricopeptide (TPR) repeat protein
LLCFVASVAYGQTKASTESFDSLTKRAAEARDSDRLEEAVKLYKEALAARANWAEGWWSLGMLEYDRNNYEAAARAFRHLLPLAPKDGTAHAMLGLCEFELGQDAAALKHIEEGKSLGIAKNSQLLRVVLYHDGILLLRAGKFRGAQSSLAGMCAEGMAGQEVLLTLGQAFFRITPATGPPPSSPGAEILTRAGHAQCLASQKKYDEARQEYRALVEQFPEYPNMRYAYGRFLMEANEPEAAIEEFKKELDRNPDDVTARLEIAAALYKVDSAAGLPYAEEAVKRDGRMPFGHYLLGLLYLDTDDYLKAIPELEVAEKAFPREAKVYFALGSAYSRAGRKQDADRARATFQRLNKDENAESKASY